MLGTVSRPAQTAALPSKLLKTLTGVLAITTPDTKLAQIFDRSVKRAHRERAAYLRRNGGEDPLQAELAERLLDRLEDCKRDFPVAAVLGGATESVVKRLRGGRAGVEKIFCLDQSRAMLNRVENALQEDLQPGQAPIQVHCVEAEEECLPLGYGSVDVIISCLGLHWVNDVPGAMSQCRRALKPDGLFLAAMWGGNTLQHQTKQRRMDQELRIACTIAEDSVEGGVSQRVSPLVQVRDAGNLLTRAGLNIPSVDVDEVSMQYRSPMELVRHLRLMGESNAVAVRQSRLRTQTWEATCSAYLTTLTNEERESGSIPATFEAIFMTGWAPHARQQQALQRGSATASFRDIEKAFRDGRPGA